MTGYFQQQDYVWNYRTFTEILNLIEIVNITRKAYQIPVRTYI